MIAELNNKVIISRSLTYG